MQNFVSTLPGTLIVRAILSDFSVTGTTTLCFVGLDHLTVSSPKYSFDYYIGSSCTLTVISYVALVYSSTAPVMTAAVSIVVPISLTMSYSSGISAIEASAPNSEVYMQGYNKKCFFSMNAIKFAFGGAYWFDLNYPFPTLNSTIVGTGSYSYMVYMCCLDVFYCSDIDPNCTNCSSRTICTDCDPGYYPYTYPNLTSRCLQCRDTLSCCLTCSSPTVCLTCDPPYVLSGTECSIQHCLNWTNNSPTRITCDACKSGYFIEDNSCLTCSQYVFGCSECYSSGGPGSIAVTCTVCYSEYRLVTGGCTDIVGCTAIYPGTNICLSCLAALYDPAPIDNAC